MTDTGENIETGARPSLADPNMVDRLIRDWTMNVFGMVGTPGFMAKLDFECRRMNSLFLGIIPSDKYVIGPWNAPDHLGEYILKALAINGETRLAVRDAFMLHVSKLLDVYKPGEDFEEATIEPRIDELRNALLGLPGPSPLL